MLYFKDFKYNESTKNQLNEIFSLRKEVFKDRLCWEVNCTGNMEFDQYDDSNATYLVGISNNQLVCGLRFIETQYPTMIIGTFMPYFKKISLPSGNFLEASRLFIDKSRLKKSLIAANEPVSSMLFLAKINFAIQRGYEGIYAIVSHPMMIVLRRSGWDIEVVERGVSEKKEFVYLVFMPTDARNQGILLNNIMQKSHVKTESFYSWPLSIKSRDYRVEQV